MKERKKERKKEKKKERPSVFVYISFIIRSILFMTSDIGSFAVSQEYVTDSVNPNRSGRFH